MYSSWPHVVYGFHGCEAELARAVITGETEIPPSNNSWDWLGSGVYFWENNPKRAQQWAKGKDYREPAVIGAVIDLGFCLDLLQARFLDLLPIAHEQLALRLQMADARLPENTSPDSGGTPLYRKLDCAVITELRDMLAEEGKIVQSVRGVFMEGDWCYEGAQIRKKNHVQFCIADPDCVKGYFKPRELSLRQ